MADQVSEPGFPYTVDLGLNGTHEFKSVEALRAWLNAEVGFYRFARSKPELQQLVHQYHEPLSARLSSSYRATEEFARQTQNEVLRMKRTKPGEYIHSTSAEGRWIGGLENGEWRAGALAYFVQAGMRELNTAILVGHTRALLYGIGVKETAEAERAVLADLQMKARGDFETVKGEWSAFLESSRGDAAKHNETLGNFVRRAELDTAQRQSDFNGIIQGFKGRLQDLEETYEKKLALNAPVLYWTNRAKHHRSRAFIFGGLTLLLMGGGAWGLWSVASATFGGLKEAATWADVQHWKLIALAFFVTLFLWILRLSVRIFLSNVHLETDAQERKVMMEAYLALLKEQGLNKDGDRAIALSALFRPSATGVVDDAGPNTPFDLLSRLLGKSS